MTNCLDALVIGGGPGGSTAALLLARAGWRVLVLERRDFPRSKVCGEYLSATNLPLLEQLGLRERFDSEAGPSVQRVGLFAGDTMVTADLPRTLHPRPCWGRALGRDRLDTLLLQEAARAGADVWQPWSARALVRRADRWVCQVESQYGREEREVEARVVLAAHGSWELGSLPTQQPHHQSQGADLLAFKAHFRDSSLPADLMPLLCFPGGYGGLVHSNAGRVSLSCCLRRDYLQRLRHEHQSAGTAVFAHLQDSCRGVRHFLDGARLEGHWLAAGPIRPGVRLRCGTGLFPIGNVAGEAHPVVAEGISMALQGAWLLCRELVPWRAAGSRSADLAAVGRAYSRAWRRALAPRLHAASVIAHWAMRPGAVALSLPLLRSWPALLSWGARCSGKTTEVVSV